MLNKRRRVKSSLRVIFKPYVHKVEGSDFEINDAKSFKKCEKLFDFVDYMYLLMHM